MGMIFNEYVFMLYWVAFLSVASRDKSFLREETVLGRRQLRVPMWYAIALMLPVILVAIYGDAYSDMGEYLYYFRNASTPYAYLMRLSQGGFNGFLFHGIGVLVYVLCGPNNTAYRLVMTILQITPIIIVLRKYAPDYATAVFLYLVTSTNIGWLMNGIRQGVAIAIVFAAFPFFAKKKDIIGILLILIAACCHTTAVIMIPIYIVVRGKALDSKTILLSMAGVVGIALLVSLGIFGSIFVGSEYEKTAGIITLSTEAGTSPLRVLVNCVPMLLAFFGKNQLQKDNDPVMNMCANLSVVTAALYILSAFTSGVLLGRLPGYTSMFNFMLLPYLIRRVFDRSSQKTVWGLMIALYLIYYFYQMHMVNGLF